MKDTVEFVLIEDDDRYVLSARMEPDGWYPDLYDDSTAECLLIEPIPVYLLREKAPYPTPGRCILALAEVVVAELCGVKT